MHPDATLTRALGEHLQANLEYEMKQAGVDAYLREIDRLRGTAESKLNYGQRLLRETVGRAAGAIEEALAAVTSGRPGRRNASAQRLVGMDPAVLAYLAGKALIDGASVRHTHAKCAGRLGAMVEDEQRLQKFAQVNPGAFEWTMRRVKAATTRQYKAGVSRKIMQYKDVSWGTWSTKDRILVGGWLIEKFIAATGLFAVEMTQYGSGRRESYIEATPETLEWIKKAADRGMMTACDHWPTVVPPRRWRKPWGGGYHTPLVPRMPLVKTRGHKGSKNYLGEMANRDMSLVYEAVNHVQETAWRVNPHTLAALEEVVARELNVPGLPPLTDALLPPKPADMDTNKKARDWWKKSAAMTHGSNARHRSKRIQVRRTLAMAQKFAAYPAIYFPHTMDFRGRLYSIVPFLNPQGQDCAKGLLTFAEGKPIETEEQVEWLAIHGANQYGVDKVSFADRWNWVVEHDTAVRHVAADPFETEAFKFWTAADAPFQFLAWCFEWAALMAHGYGYVSSLPVALDGSCNGIQHYSAVLRDAVGGAAVNLLPSDKPQDIYTEVAQRVLEKVTRMKDLSGQEGKLARAWVEFGIDRKIAKRPVMTLPYGSTQYSTREFIEEAIREKVASGKPNPFAYVDEKGNRRDAIFDASLFLQRPMWESIGEVVVAARQAMDWLQTVAAAVSAEDMPICWTTPDGFVVQQAYTEQKVQQVDSILDGGTRLRVAYADDSDVMCKRRQRNGIAPNWVHSMDAAALRVFVNLAADNGVRSFCLVHDSYGAVAADVPLVARALREAFVMLYRDDRPLERFFQEATEPLDEKAVRKLPPPPAEGVLDLDRVLDSPYFFA